MLPVIRFDDSPAAVVAIVTAPFKMVQVACSMDLFNNGIAVLGLMRRFNQIPIHITSLVKRLAQHAVPMGGIVDQQSTTVPPHALGGGPWINVVEIIYPRGAEIQEGN